MHAAAMEQSPGSVTIVHHFGMIEVPHDAVMRFVDPIGGFPDQQEYALLPAQRDGVWWLMSLGDAGTTFVLADPFAANATYAIDLGETEKQRLRIEAEADVIALAMVALPAAAGQQVTANFRAPIVINLRERLALQIVNRDESWSMQTPLDLAVYPRNEHGVQLA
jgi:flagellar assembly factor FliW